MSQEQQPPMPTMIEHHHHHHQQNNNNNNGSGSLFSAPDATGGPLPMAHVEPYDGENPLGDAAGGYQVGGHHMESSFGSSGAPYVPPGGGQPSAPIGAPGQQGGAGIGGGQEVSPLGGDYPLPTQVGGGGGLRRTHSNMSGGSGVHQPYDTMSADEREGREVTVHVRRAGSRASSSRGLNTPLGGSVQLGGANTDGASHHAIGDTDDVNSVHSGVRSYIHGGGGSHPGSEVHGAKPYQVQNGGGDAHAAAPAQQFHQQQQYQQQEHLQQQQQQPPQQQSPQMMSPVQQNAAPADQMVGAAGSPTTQQQPGGGGQAPQQQQHFIPAQGTLLIPPSQPGQQTIVVPGNEQGQSGQQQQIVLQPGQQLVQGGGGQQQQQAGGAQAGSAAVLTFTAEDLQATLAANPTLENIMCPPGTTFSVYDSEIHNHFMIASEKIAITEGAVKYATYHQRYGLQTRFRFQICNKYTQGRCSDGRKCNYIHGFPTEQTTSVHINENLQQCNTIQDVMASALRPLSNSHRYRTLPGDPDIMIRVHAPNAYDEPPQELRSSRIFQTAGSIQAYDAAVAQIEAAAPPGAPIPRKIGNLNGQPVSSDSASNRSRHCAHFQFRKMCNLGERCNFIHSMSPYIQPRYRDQIPSEFLDTLGLGNHKKGSASTGGGGGGAPQQHRHQQQQPQQQQVFQQQQPQFVQQSAGGQQFFVQQAPMQQPGQQFAQPMMVPQGPQQPGFPPQQGQFLQQQQPGAAPPQFQAQGAAFQQTAPGQMLTAPQAFNTFQHQTPLQQQQGQQAPGGQASSFQVQGSFQPQGQYTAAQAPGAAPQQQQQQFYVQQQQQQQAFLRQ